MFNGKLRVVFLVGLATMGLGTVLYAEESGEAQMASDGLLGLVQSQLPSLSGLVDTDQNFKQNPEQIRRLVTQIQQQSSPRPQGVSPADNRSNNKTEQNSNSQQSVPSDKGGSNVNNANKSKHTMEVGDEAFLKTLLSTMPLTPEQVVTLRRAYNLSQLAAVTTPTAPPTPVATAQEVKLAPGSTPPVIRLLQGFVTSVVFVDQSGSPWPIAAYDLGDPNVFNVQWDNKSNILLIQAQKLFTYGNLAVLLTDLNTPVMITLIPGQEEVDYRADLRIPGFGPQAKYVPTVDGLPAGANQVLLNILNGLSPEGGRSLEVVGCDCQAWQVLGKMYLRTRLPVIAPGWLGVMESPDGTKAYEMQKTPRLLVSKQGKIATVQIEGLRENG